MHTSFPDAHYLHELLTFQKRLPDKQSDIVMELVAHSGVNLNWIGDYLSDKNIIWKKETLQLDQLWLTGVNPKWNAYIIDEAKRDPAALRNIIGVHPELQDWINDISLSHLPILIRYEDEKYKVLDGMYMVLHGLINNQITIEAYTAYSNGIFSPQCEPHVVYDFIRSYTRGINKDRKGLITSLRFLKNSYSNVTPLLLDRLGPKWQPDDEIAVIINEALKE